MFTTPPAARVHNVLGRRLALASDQRHDQRRLFLQRRHESRRIRLAKTVTSQAKVTGPGKDQQLQVVFVATEVAPWSKVGGLGDVIASLPRHLASRGHAVMTVTPRYQAYNDAHDTGLQVPLQLPSNDLHQQSTSAHVGPPSKTKLEPTQQNKPASALQAWACLYHCRKNGVDRVFVDHPLFLDPLKKHSIYSVNTYLQGFDFPDLDLRYSILCQAALAAPILLWHQPAEHLYRLQLQACCSHSPHTISGGVAQYIGLLESLSWHAIRRSNLKKSNGGLSMPAVQANEFTSTSFADVSDITHHHMPSSAQARNQLRQDMRNSQSGSTEIIWPTTAGQIAFVANDWPCFPLTQRLEQLQCSSTDHSSQQLNSVVPGAEEVSSLVSTAANNFETHMARLLKSARVAFCIHNLAHQGIFPEESFSRLCFPAATVNKAHWPTAESQQHPKRPEVNWLKGAMASSHKLLTVSPSYADQILRDPTAGFGLHNFLSTGHVRGILNGIDTEVWNPMTDKHIPASMRYSTTNVTSGKAALKAMFQKKHGLNSDIRTPLVAAVGRLAPQKGFDVVLAALPKLLAPAESAATRQADDSSDRQQSKGAAEHAGCQLVMLGSGDAWMEGALSHVSKVFPGRACGLPYFCEETAHQLLAAADFLLLPSRFEPCGLIAMHGMRYGAVPIATLIGGFRDIVTTEVGYAVGCIGDYGNPAHLRHDAQVLVTAVQRAVATYGKQEYLELQQAGMMKDMSWQLPAQEWEQALQEMLTA